MQICECLEKAIARLNAKRQRPSVWVVKGSEEVLEKSRNADIGNSQIGRDLQLQHSTFRKCYWRMYSFFCCKETIVEVDAINYYSNLLHTFNELVAESQKAYLEKTQELNREVYP